MSVPTLTPVSEWPTRKLPQATFDTGVRTAMNQMSTMVSELNSGVIPGINDAATLAVVSAETAAAQSAVAVTKATEAAASATEAAASATQAKSSETIAVASAANAKSSETIAVAAATSVKDAVAIATAGSGFPVPDAAAVGQFLCVTQDSFALSGVKLAEIQTKARAYFISG